MAALKATNKELQQRYSDAFYKEKQPERENLKLKKKIEEMQNQRRSVPPSTSPFNTPVQLPAGIPGSPLVVGGFSAGSFPGAGMGANRLAPRKLGGKALLSIKNNPKTAHDPGAPKRGPQAGSNPVSYAQFMVRPRGSVRYPTSSQ